MSSESCPFCSVSLDQVFYEGQLVRGIWDAHPVSPGHALLIPRRHVATWFEASPEEQAELTNAITLACDLIGLRQGPDGFNVGINVGPAAGQTVFHLHVHVIPRYRGDVADPRGGVRHVLPARANYLVPQPTAGMLVRGDDDPLLPHLLRHIDAAERVEIVAAFVLESGVARLEAHLRDLLARGGALRLLTGDYLDVTEPNALLRLLDLEAKVELRVFEAAATSFHPKAYLFYERDGKRTAYVGSSNLTEMALAHGVEWNYRIVSSRDTAGFADVADAFTKLFRHPATRRLDYAWVESYRQRRTTRVVVPIEVAPEPLVEPPQPHSVQVEALAALEETRAAGNRAGLVVLATGLGKTWLSAFDSNRPGFRRVLFVAHREEILAQAMQTYRRIRPTAHLGHYTGTQKAPDAEVVFASIQTLGRAEHLRRFDPDAFDYVVVDEFHHALARTYRGLIDHFAPKFLLGLTATPERTDGGDLLALCEENLVYRCDLVEGIRRELLCPFHYYGVPDEVDYQNIPWRSNRFDEEALTAAVATRARAQNALEQYGARAGARTLAFCCSQRHADFMAEYFSAAGVRAVAVHAGPDSAPRATSLEQLGAGELDVVFAVDMFNEGLDLPNVDTVMMLRPTESRVIWLQQFGRGLRTADGKPHLNVIDYIGNHRTFLIKPQTLFQLGAGDMQIKEALLRLERGDAELPPRCAVTYDLRAVQIIEGLLRTSRHDDAMRLYYEDFRERHGVRPLAVEAYQEGYTPRAVRKAYSSWYRFVEAMGDLDAAERGALEQHGDFLAMLEVTSMNKSYKMLVLLAMLNAGAFPGEIGIDELTRRFSELAIRAATLRADVGRALDNPIELRRLIERNPIAAWTGGGATGGQDYFAYDGSKLHTTTRLTSSDPEVLRDLVRELVDWRLAEYLDRPGIVSEEPAEYRSEVIGQSTPTQRPVLWEPYLRAAIPPLFRLQFSTSVWNSGFVSTDDKLFLLVTLDKESISEQFQYADRFLSPDVFEWQSQNRTRQQSGMGKRIRDHAALGIEVHLFVRHRGKTPAGSGMPFRYGGQVDFIDWQGDAPITVQWRLRTRVPERLFEEFRLQHS